MYTLVKSTKIFKESSIELSLEEYQKICTVMNIYREIFIRDHDKADMYVKTFDKDFIHKLSTVFRAWYDIIYEKVYEMIKESGDPITDYMVDVATYYALYGNLCLDKFKEYCLDDNMPEYHLSFLYDD